jgi:hypothetical protein
MKQTPAQKREQARIRKRQERERIREQGLTIMQVAIKPEYKQAVLDYARQLNQYEGDE